MRYINPETEGVHPLRLELSDDDMDFIIEAIENGDIDDITVEEMEAATDYLFDFICMKTQTHPGETLLQ
jgi:hypothetical protein